MNKIKYSNQDKKNDDFEEDIFAENRRKCMEIHKLRNKPQKILSIVTFISTTLSVVFMCTGAVLYSHLLISIGFAFVSFSILIYVFSILDACMNSHN